MTKNTQFKPQIIQEIGDNLKIQRKKAKFTIEELSKASGVSIITISNIENHKSNPTVTVLWRLAESLQVPFTRLFSAQTKIPIRINKLSNRTFINDDNQNWDVEPIYNQGNTEVYRIKLSAHSSYTTQSQPNDPVEIVTVMSGQLTLIIDAQTYLLNEFESITFSAVGQHSYKNETNHDIFLNIVVKYQNI